MFEAGESQSMTAPISLAFTIVRSALTEISQGQSNPPLFSPLEDGVQGGTKGVCGRVMLQRGC